MDLNTGRTGLAGGAHVSRTADPANRHQRRAFVQLAGEFCEAGKTIAGLWQDHGQLIKTSRRRHRSRHRQSVSAITERQFERHRQMPSTFRPQAVALKSNGLASSGELRPMFGLHETLIRLGAQIEAQVINRRPESIQSSQPDNAQVICWQLRRQADTDPQPRQS